MIDVKSPSLSCTLMLYFFSFLPIYIIRITDRGMMASEISVSFQLIMKAIVRNIANSTGCFIRSVNVTETVFCIAFTSVINLEIMSPDLFSL